MESLVEKASFCPYWLLQTVWAKKPERNLVRLLYRLKARFCRSGNEGLGLLAAGQSPCCRQPEPLSQCRITLPIQHAPGGKADGLRRPHQNG